MSNQAELGSKYTCFKCTCKFYDLKAPEPLCPGCGADQREDPNPDPRAAFLARLRRPSPPPRHPPKPKVVKEAEPEKLEAEDDLLDDDFADDLEKEDQAVTKAVVEATAPTV